MGPDGCGAAWTATYALHGLTAAVAASAGVGAFFTRKHRDAHRALGTMYVHLVTLSLAGSLPLLVNRPDDVLLVTVPVMLSLNNLGLRGSAALTSLSGQRAVAAATALVGIVFCTMTLARAAMSNGQPAPWVLGGAMLVAIGVLDLQEHLRNAVVPPMSTRAHGLIMMSTVVLCVESASISVVPEVIRAFASEVAIRVGVLALGVIAAAVHLWDTRRRPSRVAGQVLGLDVVDVTTPRATRGA